MSSASEKKYKYVSLIRKQNKVAPQQCRLTHREISELAGVLVDGTVFGIIAELKDIQNIYFASLRKEKDELEVQHKAKKETQAKGQQQAYEIMTKGEGFLPSYQEKMIKRFKLDKIELEKKAGAELEKFDRDILLKLDNQVKDQQQYLNIAGIPGMDVTDDTDKIRKQMFILDIIENLPQLD